MPCSERHHGPATGLGGPPVFGNTRRPYPGTLLTVQSKCSQHMLTSSIVVGMFFRFSCFLVLIGFGRRLQKASFSHNTKGWKAENNSVVKSVPSKPIPQFGKCFFSRVDAWGSLLARLRLSALNALVECTRSFAGVHQFFGTPFCRGRATKAASRPFSGGGPCVGLLVCVGVFFSRPASWRCWRLLFVAGLCGFWRLLVSATCSWLWALNQP